MIRDVEKVIENIINIQDTMKNENTDLKKKQVKLLKVITIVINFNGLDMAKEKISVLEERSNSNSECITKAWTYELVIKATEDRMKKKKSFRRREYKMKNYSKRKRLRIFLQWLRNEDKTQDTQQAVSWVKKYKSKP